MAGRVWGWLRSWGGRSPQAEKQQERVSWSAWIWRGWQAQTAPAGEEFWEAQEKLADKEEGVAPTWWRRYLPALPRGGQPGGVKRRKGRGEEGDGDSDYGTPPPSPPPILTSPFRFFAHGWNAEIAPEHYEICFNFLRHLFDLLVVGFLWTVSPPAKLVLEVLGVQGALRLWLHGMAMFLVATVGMAGLLWVIQEYLPQFALVYGILQALVISVSLRQSLILGPDQNQDHGDADEMENGKELED